MATYRKEIASLRERIGALENSQSLIVPIETFAPEPYELIHSFHVVLQSHEGEYMASFFDANLSTSGETKEEALYNLKDIIIATFNMLREHKKSQLGPGPKRQLEVLLSFIKSI